MKETQADYRPHIRMAGARVLEMIKIGDLLEQAKLHPDQIASIKLMSTFLSNHYSGSSFSDTEQYHFNYVATIILYEIEKLEANIKH
jgi:hypothetical protein